MLASTALPCPICLDFRKYIFGILGAYWSTLGSFRFWGLKFYQRWSKPAVGHYWHQEIINSSLILSKCHLVVKFCTKSLTYLWLQVHKDWDHKDLVFQHIFGLCKCNRVGNRDQLHIRVRNQWWCQVWESNQASIGKLGFQVYWPYMWFQDHKD